MKILIKAILFNKIDTALRPYQVESAPGVYLIIDACERLISIFQQLFTGSRFFRYLCLVPGYRWLASRN